MRSIRAINTLPRSNAATSTLLRTTSSLVQNSRPAGCPLTIPTAHAVATNYGPWNRPVAGRPFSHTTKCQKRKASNNNNNHIDNSTTTQPPTSSSAGAAAAAATTGDNDVVNPFDFTDLQQAFDRTEKRFTEDLKKLRSGGRFNADAIGTIQVQPDKKNPQTFALRELATVAPLGGRRWSILAFEESSVKPIISAVQRSDEFNQQPQRSEQNPLELTMTVEPERADALAKRAKEVCQAWRTRVREEAHRRAEMHKKWRGEGLFLSDDAHKLREKLQKLQDERMKGILVKEKEVVNGILARAG